MADTIYFTARLKATIESHDHPDHVSVITHKDYEPYVKLVCSICSAETYVSRLDPVDA